MKKSVSTLLISSALLGGVYATQTATVHAATTADQATTTTSNTQTSDENTADVTETDIANTATTKTDAAATAQTATAPAGQQADPNGVNDQVDPVKVADADDGVAVGTSGKTVAKAYADTDYDGNDTGSNTVFVSGTDDDEADQPFEIDSNSLYQNETSHYAEKQTDGSWKINSITATTGAKTAGRKDFTIDVKDLSANVKAAGDKQETTVTLTDGVTADVSVYYYADDTAKLTGSAPGLTYNVAVDGTNVMNESYLQKASADDDYLGMDEVISYAGVPLLFHYYVGDAVYTGTLTLTNGQQAASTTPAVDDTKADTTTPVETDTDTTADTSTKTEVTTPVVDDSTATTTPNAGGELTAPTTTETTAKTDATKQTAAKVAAAKPAAQTTAKTTQVKAKSPVAKPVAKPVAAKATKTATNALPTTGETRSSLGLLGVVVLAMIALLTPAKLRKRH